MFFFTLVVIPTVGGAGQPYLLRDILSMRRRVAFRAVLRPLLVLVVFRFQHILNREPRAVVLATDAGLATTCIHRKRLPVRFAATRKKKKRPCAKTDTCYSLAANS
jgi:hypothetical protein